MSFEDYSGYRNEVESRGICGRTCSPDTWCTAAVEWSLVIGFILGTDSRMKNGSQEVQRLQLLGFSDWPEYLMFLDYKLKVSRISPSTATRLTLLL